jgi:hypothetical protein
MQFGILVFSKNVKITVVNLYNYILGLTASAKQPEYIKF